MPPSLCDVAAFPKLAPTGPSRTGRRGGDLSPGGHRRRRPTRSTRRVVKAREGRTAGLPSAETIQFSRHAVAQYADRSQGGLSINAARSKLNALRRSTRVEVVAGRPDWVHRTDTARRAREHAVAYVILDRRFAFPVVARGGRLRATTCLLGTPDYLAMYPEDPPAVQGRWPDVPTLPISA